MAVQKTTPSKATSVETLKASKALEKSAADLTKVLNSIEKFKDTVTSINEEVDAKQAELQGLNEEYSLKVRNAEVELKLKIRENEEVELKKLLTVRNVVTINRDDLLELENKEVTIQAQADASILAIKQQLKDEAKRELDSKIQALTAEHQIANAEVAAKVTTLTDKVSYLEASLVAANKTIDAEREARVNIAQNSSQPTINVGSAK